MPSWKKVIVSGSDATLNSLYVTNAVTASFFTGSFIGDGSGLINLAAPEFSMIEFSPIEPPETVLDDTFVLYMKASGSTPNRELTQILKNQLGQEIILTTLII